MKRREFVRSAIAATLAPALLKAQTAAPVSPDKKVVAPGPLPWMNGVDHIDATAIPRFGAERIGEDEGHLFTKVQMETLVRLCEVLMPPMGNDPGAVECLTPEFLDFFVSRSDLETKTLYQTGLDMMETRAQQANSLSFAKLDAAQVDALIRPLLVAWMKEHLPKELDKRFVNRVHYDIRMATRNSGTWAMVKASRGGKAWDGMLYWFPVEPIVDYSDNAQNTTQE